MSFVLALASYAGMTPSALLGNPGSPIQANGLRVGGLAAVKQDALGVLTVPVWTVPNVAAPTAAQIAAWQTAGPTAAQLVSYASSKQVALRDGGITVNVGTASTPDEVNVASDVNGRSLVTGSVQLVGLASANGQPAPTFPWINDGGTQLMLTSAQIMTIGYKLSSFIQATYNALGAVLAAIANGTITTTAQIDAAAWPTTAY